MDDQTAASIKQADPVDHSRLGVSHISTAGSVLQLQNLIPPLLKFNHPFAAPILLLSSAQKPHLDLQTICLHSIESMLQFPFQFCYIFVNSALLAFHLKNLFRQLLHFPIDIDLLIHGLFLFFRQGPAGRNRYLSVAQKIKVPVFRTKTSI